jgi:hypothetical protein
MSSRTLSLLLLIILLMIGIAAVAQSSTTKAVAVDNAFVQKQFGTTCKLLAEPAPYVGDLDGDGVQDVVMAANCKDPMMDQAEHDFKVIDPYNTFFGYGDPKVTTAFASEDPALRGQALLVIHGAGNEAWRSDTPKAKFILVNLPYKQVMIKKLTVKKKTVTAIYAEELGGDHQTSATFWDGKKYRYQPMGSTLD